MGLKFSRCFFADFYADETCYKREPKVLCNFKTLFRVYVSVGPFNVPILGFIEENCGARVSETTLVLGSKGFILLVMLSNAIPY